MLKAQVGGLLFVVGFCLLIRQGMVGKCSTSVEALIDGLLVCR